MLIDQHLPSFDVTVVRRIDVAATPEETWAALRAADLGRVSRTVNALGWLRDLPARMSRVVRREAPPPRTPRITLDDIVRAGPWVLLDERAPEEIVLGAVGRFWRPVIEWRQISPPEFAPFEEPNFAKLAIAFRVERRGEAGSRLRYEARTATTDTAGRRHFRAYWRLIGPFAALIMERAVEAIGAEAEALHRERRRAAERSERPEPPRPAP